MRLSKTLGASPVLVYAFIAANDGNISTMRANLKEGIDEMAKRSGGQNGQNGQSRNNGKGGDYGNSQKSVNTFDNKKKY